MSKIKAFAIHDFHNGGHSAGPGDSSMKTRSQRPLAIVFVYCSMASSSSDSCKGLKTKAELVKRVHEYIRTGKDKDVVDLDPDKIYSRRKERSNTTTNIESEDGVSVQFPVDGWSTSLEKMPMFTRLEMNRHIMKSGKSIANKDHHTVPTALIKQGSTLRPIQSHLRLNFTYLRLEKRQ